MKTMIYLLILILFSCNQNNAEQAPKENIGEKMLSEAEVYLTDQEYGKAKKILEDICKRFPDTNEFSEASKKLLDINKVYTERLERASQTMDMTYDDFKDVLFYTHKSSPKGVSQAGVFAYIATNDYYTNLRFAINYSASEFLFIKSYIVKADDKSFDFESDVKLDHSGGLIWEWTDRLVGSKDYEIIKAIAYAESAKIRFQGRDYYYDKEITEQEKEAFREILELYEALDGNTF
jgi:tetratricopeptide (TPR) repeat protein